MTNQVKEKILNKHCTFIKAVGCVLLNLAAGSTKYPEESKQCSRIPMRNLDDDLRQLDIEDKENKREEDNKETLQQLRTINKNLDTLTKTVLLMERRLSLVEDQIKLMSQKNDN